MEIITTVGTSLITNYFDKEKNKNVNETYKSFYNDKLRSKSFSEDEWKRLSENNHFSKFKEELKKWIENNKDNSCAEIKTLNKLPKDNTNYHFLTTYTIDGFFVGEILCEYFERDKDKFLHRIEGLQVENAKDFKDKGVNNLIAKIKEIKKDNNEVILNISGGYKAIIPILTIIGQIENIPLKYIYEDSDELIEIPELNIDFDFTFIEEHYNAFELLKKKELNLPTYDEFSKIVNENNLLDKWINKEKIIEVFDFENEKKVKFSYIGKLIFEKYEELFNKKLLKRQNLISKLVEMYIFEYYVYKKQSDVLAGKKLGEQNYDVDVYIEDEKCIHAIEVKPGGNIPTNDIMQVFKEKAFKWLVDNHNNKKLKFEVILYHYREPLKHVVENIKKQLEELKDFKDHKIIFTWLKLDFNYKTDMNWKVTKEKLENLFIIKPSKENNC